MGIVGAAHFIFDLYWHQPDSVALSLCIGCDRWFLFGCGLGHFFALARKKIDIKKNGTAVGLAWVIFSMWLEKKLTSRKTELQLDT